MFLQLWHKEWVTSRGAHEVRPKAGHHSLQNIQFFSFVMQFNGFGNILWFVCDCSIFVLNLISKSIVQLGKKNNDQKKCSKSKELYQQTKRTIPKPLNCHKKRKTKNVVACFCNYGTWSGSRQVGHQRSGPKPAPIACKTFGVFLFFAAVQWFLYNLFGFCWTNQCCCLI